MFFFNVVKFKRNPSPFSLVALLMSLLNLDLTEDFWSLLEEMVLLLVGKASTLQHSRPFKKHKVKRVLFIYILILLLGGNALWIKFTTHILCPLLPANNVSLNQNAEA